MDHGEVMDELAARLGEITGLRAYGWPLGSVTPPAAVVGYPTRFTFDETYGRGTDTAQIPAVVVVGKVTERSTRDAISQFTRGGGPRAVKRVLEGGTYRSFDTVRVSGGEYDVYTLGGVDYVAAIFDLDIAGPGSS